MPHASPAIRPAAVAGMFYPGATVELRRTVDVLLAEASNRSLKGPVPKALIVPHAGYVYSGPVAATAYARLLPARGRITRVVILGPAHRVWFDGLALPAVDALATPLGSLKVDLDAAARASALPQVISSAEPHAEEHSLEVQLPFVQRALGDVAVVPFVVGDASAADVAEVIELLWGGEETLFLISSDLSHYHPWGEARTLDAEAARQIRALGPMLNHEQACGATPVDGMLLAAKRHGMNVEILDLRNSGDTAGGRDRVVGYGAFAFHESTTARSA
ncbi:MAG TPA: AmmeMemoRadiSam system protein B [bacterium]|nr:AmmeMemoRadiSam system protein B [bacterium]